ncbi:MAG TPA: glutamine amidotransferase family protein [Chthoniobacterales bacterium]
MCGIAGLFLKNKSLETQLGTLFSGMLDCMSSRGADSAGFAIYGSTAPAGFLKLTLQHPGSEFPWKQLSSELKTRFGEELTMKTVSNHAIFIVRGEEAEIRKLLREYFPDVNIMSVGQRIEIMKETGLPCTVLERFGVRNMTGSHAVGHTRMATESAVTTAGSHPFSTGRDLCLVHNGSLSNHNRLREKLRREGISFQTENDSEVAAGYLTWRLSLGDALDEALNHALEDLDGFYTFTIGTRDGFAVLRDPIACKPAVMAETKDYVAMASEYRSLATLPGIEQARLWEPEPATVYTWSVSTGVNRG